MSASITINLTTEQQARLLDLSRLAGKPIDQLIIERTLQLANKDRYGAFTETIKWELSEPPEPDLIVICDIGTEWAIASYENGRWYRYPKDSGSATYEELDTVFAWANPQGPFHALNLTVPSNW